MSCPPPAYPIIPGAFDDSDDSSSTTDYGSDFSPEEDALLTDLLAKIAPDRHAITTTAPAEAAAHPPPSQVAPVIRDIEDQYADPSNSWVPRVLGREKPTWPQRNWANRPGGGGARAAAIPGYGRAASAFSRASEFDRRARERSRTRGSSSSGTDREGE
ncbi:hypothetical protein ACMYSQ_001166 [Aspergillus niger]